MEWLGEVLVGVKLDSQVSLDAASRLDAFETALVQLLRHLPDLADLGLETSVFCLLSLLSLHNHIIQNANLFLEVALDVIALSFGDVFDRVLLGLELTDFFACV